MRKISTARSSRRAPGLKDSDYDHEIALVDHAAEDITPQTFPSDLSAQTDQTDHALAPTRTAETEQIPPTEQTAVSTSLTAKPAPAHPRVDDSDARSTASASGAAASTKSKKNKDSLQKSSELQGPKERAGIPRVELQEPTPLNKPRSPNDSPRNKASRETAIDVLYENQRGGFLCGIPLFSPKALGQLDPPPWTNFAHKPSPTNIHNAQVPDPSWVWVWPEWHVNKDDGVDENGFEYSFMFHKSFSWHLPRWYNSFVRRRAWTRKRIRKDPDSNDPHMLSSEYFTVRRSVDTTRSVSKASSRHSRASLSISSSFDAGENPAIDTIEALMAVLSRARIDREKIEAVENFLEHGEEELKHLQHRMHDIMGMFVFQASRRVLLTKLNEVYDAAVKELQERDTGRLQRRSNNLKAAIRHADEECRRLEYWSDKKKLLKKGGDTSEATDKCNGWNASCESVDSEREPSLPGKSKCNV